MNQEIAGKVGQDKPIQVPSDAYPGTYKDNVEGTPVERTVAYLPTAEEPTPFKVTQKG